MSGTSHRADWLSRGSFGLMVHYLVTPPGHTEAERAAEFSSIADGFRLDDFVGQFASTGADWLIFTIGQNTGYYNSPNEWLDARLPGHTPRRDLHLEIAQRVEGFGKRLISYLPSEVKAQSDAIHEVFAWNPADQSEFQRRYQAFIAAYSRKLGRLNDGWWFDGCYTWPDFHNSLYDWPAWRAAALAGNLNAIVAFNDGSFAGGLLKPITPFMDYTSGEVAELVDGKIKFGYQDDAPLYMPDGRFLDGVQWHALVPVDSSFGGPDRHYADEELFGFVDNCKAVGGAVTLNLPIGIDGVVPAATVAQMQRLGHHLEARSGLGA